MTGFYGWLFKTAYCSQLSQTYGWLQLSQTPGWLQLSQTPGWLAGCSCHRQQLAGCLSPGKPLRFKAVFEVTAAAHLSAAHGVRMCATLNHSAEDPLGVDTWTFGHSSAPLALPLYRVQQAVFFQRQLLILNTSILLYKKRAHDEQ